VKQYIFFIILSMSLLGCPVAEDPENCCDPYLLIGEWTAQLEEPIPYDDGTSCPADGTEQSALFDILAVDIDDTFRFEFMNLGVDESSEDDNFHLQLANCVPGDLSLGTEIMPEAGHLLVQVDCIVDESRFSIDLFGFQGGPYRDRFEDADLFVYVSDPDGLYCGMNWNIEVTRSNS